jgi:hypothetical protein
MADTLASRLVVSDWAEAYRRFCIDWRATVVPTEHVFGEEEDDDPPELAGDAMTSIQSRSGAECEPSPKNCTVLVLPAVKPVSVI